MSKITLLGSVVFPRFNEMAYRLESEGLEVEVHQYAQFGPQVWIEDDGLFGKKEITYGVLRDTESKVVPSAQFIEPPTFDRHPPTHRDVTRWLSEYLKHDGYRIQQFADDF